MEELIKELEYAKQAVITIINSADTIVDMHGLAYWAGVVERLRNKIREKL